MAKVTTQGSNKMGGKIDTRNASKNNYQIKDAELAAKAKSHMFDSTKYNELSAAEDKKEADSKRALEQNYGSGEAYNRKSDQELRTLSNDTELMGMQNRSELSRINRERDMNRGKERGEELFGEGSLGRIDASRSADMSEIIANRQDVMRNGLGAEAFQASREARLGGLQRSEQMAARQMRSGQAGSGVTGPLAQAQQMALLGQQQTGRQGAERQMLLDNVQLKNQALGAAEQSITGAEATETGKTQYNQDRLGREKLGVLTTMMGEAALGASERGAAIQGEAAKAYASAAANQGGGGKK